MTTSRGYLLIRRSRVVRALVGLVLVGFGAAAYAAARDLHGAARDLWSAAAGAAVGFGLLPFLFGFREVLLDAAGRELVTWSRWFSLQVRESRRSLAGVARVVVTPERVHRGGPAGGFLTYHLSLEGGAWTVELGRFLEEGDVRKLAWNLAAAGGWTLHWRRAAGETIEPVPSVVLLSPGAADARRTPPRALAAAIPPLLVLGLAALSWSSLREPGIPSIVEEFRARSSARLDALRSVGHQLAKLPKLEHDGCAFDGPSPDFTWRGNAKVLHVEDLARPGETVEVDPRLGGDPAWLNDPASLLRSGRYADGRLPSNPGSVRDELVGLCRVRYVLIVRTAPDEPLWLGPGVRYVGEAHLFDLEAARHLGGVRFRAEASDPIRLGTLAIQALRAQAREHMKGARFE